MEESKICSGCLVIQTRMEPALSLAENILTTEGATKAPGTANSYTDPPFLQILLLVT